MKVSQREFRHLSGVKAVSAFVHSAQERYRRAKHTPEHRDHLSPGLSVDSFLALLGDGSLGNVFRDDSPVSFTDPSLTWLCPPSPAFLDYIIERQPLPFDGVPPDPNQYTRDPTFMICQSHRLSVTTGTINQYLGQSDTVVDFGAFPFSIDVILRDYFAFSGPILATANLLLPDVWQLELEKRAIDIDYVNLDPLVDPGGDVPNIPQQVKSEDASVDLVIFAHVIEHLYHPLDVVAEAHRILRPGGKFVVSTDNAFMLDALCNLWSLHGYVHEPVQGTAAMSFHFWRGHNRFFSALDLTTMLESAGFAIIETQFHDIQYNAFIPGYFQNPSVSLPRWRAEILGRVPQYRNEITIVAEKKRS